MKLILGGPGTGKTTRLLSIVEEKIASGIDPARIAFVSFTRKAAGEAAERAAVRFDMQRSDLPYFRTLHSLAYGLSGVARNEIMSELDYVALGEMVGMNFTREMPSALEGPMVAGGDGDKMLQILAYSRATCTSLEDAWHRTGEAVEWFALKYFVDSYRFYKRDTYKIDFDDMLDRFVDNCDPVDVDVVIIDEAQDLSVRQWNVARHAFGHVPDIYIAGDDDQAIYRWSGADVEHFLGLRGDVEVLPVSYRLPREVYDLANQVSGRIAHRYDKSWTCADHDGSVMRSNHNEEFDYGDGTWMILARSHHFLQQFKHDVESAGYAYRTNRTTSIDEDEVAAIKYYEHARQGGEISLANIEHVNGYLGHNRIDELPKDERGYTHDELSYNYALDMSAPWYDALLTIGDARRQYYQALLRNNVDLQAEPSIYIGTIHSVKGGEADNVALCTDITYRTRMGFDLAPDDEHRVFYTGLTRTRKNLYVLDPVTTEYYTL
jgi:superfamily I DNA/RNA helicase